MNTGNNSAEVKKARSIINVQAELLLFIWQHWKSSVSSQAKRNKKERELKILYSRKAFPRRTNRITKAGGLIEVNAL